MSAVTLVRVTAFGIIVGNSRKEEHQFVLKKDMISSNNYKKAYLESAVYPRPSS